jgi:L-cysteine/cystine lyase
VLVASAKNYSLPTSRASAPEKDFWSKLRADFPLSNKRVYFNNGTFGPSPYAVLRTVEKQLALTNHTGEYGNTTAARANLADFLGIAPEELSLTHNTTEGINIVCWGLPLRAGDEVVVTQQEHVGNALPWLHRARLHGIVIRPFELAPTAEQTLDRLRQITGPRTRVYALPHVTCTTGQVLPIREISRLARSKNIFTAIDGAHGAGTFDLNVSDLGCDTYATCGHKWLLGPNGTGLLYVRRAVLESIQAYHVGAYSADSWQVHRGSPSSGSLVPTAHRFDYGSQSTPLFAGVAAAADFHRQVGRQRIEARLRSLNEQLYRGLSQMPDRAQLLTPAEGASRLSMVTFRPQQLAYREFNNRAARAGFRLRVVPESDLNAIRVSTHIYNSPAEIDRFLAFVAETR